MTPSTMAVTSTVVTGTAVTSTAVTSTAVKATAVPTTAVLPARVMAASEWRARRADHQRRVDGWLAEHLAKRRQHGRNSIEEFLFSYYHYRPSQLRRWHPGHGVALDGVDVAEAAEFGSHYAYDRQNRLHVDVAAILNRRHASIEWISSLLTATAGRAPHFGCFGMHEWAMVYRQTEAETRHNIFPLRLGATATSTLVEELRIKCSHFDAFRFFTPPARPLNLLQPTRDNQTKHEQPGCLHANMDTYRWAYKLAPLTPGELVADCFALATQIRTLDMRASPYDLTALGLDPIAVETPEGRAEYIRHQRGFAEQAAVLRDRLIGVCAAVLQEARRQPGE